MTVTILRLTLTAVSHALVPVMTDAGVGAVKVDTVGVVTADIWMFQTLVHVDVAVATCPATVLTRRTTGSDVTRIVGSTPTVAFTVNSPTTDSTR